jgi:hypothetical protein
MKTDPSISRLREANPFPPATTVDADELFERITATAPDPRLVDRRTTPSRRRMVVLAIGLAVMVVLASSAFALSTWVFGDAVEPPVTRAEYVRAQKELTLPPGYTWPVLNVPEDSVTGRGAGGGHAVVIAQNAWECYWVQAIQDGDTAAQQRAHHMLNSLLAHNIIEAPVGASENWTPPNPPKVPYAVFAHDGGLDWIRASYAQAAAGHPQNLIDSCRANAPS